LDNKKEIINFLAQKKLKSMEITQAQQYDMGAKHRVRNSNSYSVQSSASSVNNRQRSSNSESSIDELKKNIEFKNALINVILAKLKSNNNQFNSVDDFINNIFTQDLIKGASDVLKEQISRALQSFNVSIGSHHNTQEIFT
jgi:hypothetical protein